MTSGSRPPGSRPPRRLRTSSELLSLLAWPIVGLLAVEFLLGMSLNLFGSLPTGSPGMVLLGSPILLTHFAVGLLLVGITARATWVATRVQDARRVGAAALGLLSSLLAFGAGAEFTFGSQAAVASFVMSAGFVGILVSALLLLGWAVRPAAEGSAPRGPEAGLTGEGAA